MWLIAGIPKLMLIWQSAAKPFSQREVQRLFLTEVDFFKFEKPHFIQMKKI
nr:MAG TPA: hypothetical protein [Caudoviricetes sp.]